MKTYIISYDLRKDRDYKSLIEAIKSYSNWAKALEALWVVVTNKSAEEIRNHLQSKMDSDDGIFVVKSWREAAWSKVICDGKRLQNNL